MTCKLEKRSRKTQSCAPHWHIWKLTHQGHLQCLLEELFEVEGYGLYTWFLEAIFQAYFYVSGNPPKVKPPPVNLMGWTLVPNWCWDSQWMGWLSFEHPVGIKESHQALTSFQALRHMRDFRVVLLTVSTVLAMDRYPYQSSSTLHGWHLYHIISKISYYITLYM